MLVHDKHDPWSCLCLGTTIAFICYTFCCQTLYQDDFEKPRSYSTRVIICGIVNGSFYFFNFINVVSTGYGCIWCTDRIISVNFGRLDIFTRHKGEGKKKNCTFVSETLNVRKRCYCIQVRFFKSVFLKIRWFSNGRIEGTRLWRVSLTTVLMSQEHHAHREPDGGVAGVRRGMAQLPSRVPVGLQGGRAGQLPVEHQHGVHRRVRAPRPGLRHEDRRPRAGGQEVSADGLRGRARRRARRRQRQHLGMGRSGHGRRRQADSARGRLMCGRRCSGQRRGKHERQKPEKKKKPHKNTRPCDGKIGVGPDG